MAVPEPTLDEIFNEALHVTDIDQRRRYLEQMFPQSPERVREFEKLLQCGQDLGDFLERSPVLDWLSSEEETRAPGSVKTTEKSGDDESGRLGSLPCQFGDYELLERIAQGGMGVVYRARQISLNRIVAIKMILSGEFAGQEEISRFRVEAEAAGRLDHAGIVPVFDIGCHQGQHYFSMQFIEGTSLGDLVKQQSLDSRSAAMLARKIACAIQVAHDHGIVHRDLKPGNVLIDRNGEPRITDFGLAKRVESDGELTKSGMVLGTPSYMPPEQAAGSKIDTAADVYSLGAILYAMLTGRPPFEGKTQLDTILQVIREEPKPPRHVNPKVPRELETICLKCLEKKIERRYASAQNLAEDLDRFLKGIPVQAKNDLFSRLRKWSRREPVLASHLLATAIMIVMIFSSWLMLGSTARDRELLGINIGILLGWAALVFLFQKLHSKLNSRYLLPYAWAACNPLLLTLLISCNDPPRNSLISIYLLLIVSQCFFRRFELVIVTTAVALIGYVGLIVFAFNETELGFPSYLIIQFMTILVSGFLLSLVSRRLRQYEDEQQNSPPRFQRSFD